MKNGKPRNPGPVGGYHLLIFFRHALPDYIYNILVSIGSLIAMLSMRPQRMASRRYLHSILGREPTWRDIWKHFTAFAHTLVFRLEVGASKDSRLCHPMWHGEEFMQLVRSNSQILFGTLHIGCADVLGYALSEGFCPVYMIRLKKGNSHDTERFQHSYRGVKLIWANDPQGVLMGIHSAVTEGASITMQCDRPDYSSRNEMFDFLGRRRRFPVTIYHLSAIYKMPVAFCFAIYNGNEVDTYAPAPFHPNGTKKEILQAGHEHFQSILHDVEGLLRDHPYQWFNFEDDLSAPKIATDVAANHA